MAAVVVPGANAAVSFTVEGPAVVHAGHRAVHVGRGPSRVELARERRGWILAVGDGPAMRTRQRPSLRVDGGRVRDRLVGRGPVALLAARLLARSVHPGWLPGGLERTGAWMRGMPAAALWRVGELDRRRRAAWWRRAAAATLRLRGGEHADTHDVGFLYGEGAAYGYDAACGRRRRAGLGARRCGVLKASALAAADRLATMIRANAPAAMLPTGLQRCPDCPPGARETIVDSMMNVGLLTWAERRAGHPGYTDLALAHARAVAQVLVRPDGCTAQAVFTDGTSGRTFGVHTHQGLSAGSTWARGQAWALLGYARLARDTGDAGAARVARSLADCWLAKAPPRRPVLFDLDATAGPSDSSARAVAAVGLATLGRRAAARTQLRIVEAMVSAVPPLGRLGGQTYVAGGDPSDDDVELPIGQLYVLEALARLR
jgi:hypothetical protein